MNQPPQKPKPGSGSVASASRLPSIVDAAASLSRNALRPVRHPAPVAPSEPVTGPGDLVARALAILAEETEACAARRGANVLPGRAR